jgi:hypothetical protein
MLGCDWESVFGDRLARQLFLRVTSDRRGSANVFMFHAKGKQIPQLIFLLN